MSASGTIRAVGRGLRSRPVCRVDGTATAGWVSALDSAGIDGIWLCVKSGCVGCPRRPDVGCEGGGDCEVPSLSSRQHGRAGERILYAPDGRARPLGGQAETQAVSWVHESCPQGKVRIWGGVDSLRL